MSRSEEDTSQTKISAYFPSMTAKDEQKDNSNKNTSQKEKQKKESKIKKRESDSSGWDDFDELFENKKASNENTKRRGSQKTEKDAWLENIGNMKKQEIIEKLQNIKLSQGAINVLNARKNPSKDSTFHCNDLGFQNVFKSENYSYLKYKHFDWWMFPYAGLIFFCFFLFFCLFCFCVSTSQ